MPLGVVPHKSTKLGVVQSTYHKVGVVSPAGGSRGDANVSVKKKAPVQNLSKAMHSEVMVSFEKVKL